MSKKKRVRSRAAVLSKREKERVKRRQNPREARGGNEAVDEVVKSEEAEEESSSGGEQWAPPVERPA
jgi:hypothetical protein